MDCWFQLQERMKDMFKGKSVYSEAMAAQAEKAAAAKVQHAGLCRD